MATADEVERGEVVRQRRRLRTAIAQAKNPTTGGCFLGGAAADVILALPEMVELQRDAANGRWLRRPDGPAGRVPEVDEAWD